jgi:putative protein kinase ArgK-like GTPase of G3E family
VPADERAKALTRFRRRLRDRSRRVFGISAVDGSGVRELLNELADALDAARAERERSAATRAEDAEHDARVADDVLRHSLEARAARRRQKNSDDTGDDEVEVIYRA